MLQQHATLSAINCANTTTTTTTALPPSTQLPNKQGKQIKSSDPPTVRAAVNLHATAFLLFLNNFKIRHFHSYVQPSASFVLSLFLLFLLPFFSLQAGIYLFIFILFLVLFLFLFWFLFLYSLLERLASKLKLMSECHFLVIIIEIQITDVACVLIHIHIYIL